MWSYRLWNTMKIQQRLIIFFSLFLVILITGCTTPQDSIQTIPTEESDDSTTSVDDRATESSNGISNGITNETSNEDLEVNLEEVIVRVNGDEILVRDIVEFQEQMIMQNQEISQEQALDQLIAQLLLEQELERMNFEVTDEDAMDFLQEQLMFQGLTVNEYRRELENAGISFESELESIKQNLEFDLFIEELIDGRDFDVTQDQIEEYYELLQVQMGGQLPPLEELEGQIIDMIRSEFQQEMLNRVVQELQEDAQIELN